MSKHRDPAGRTGNPNQPPGRHVDADRQMGTRDPDRIPDEWLDTPDRSPNDPDRLR